MFEAVKQLLREDQVDVLTRGELNDRFDAIRKLRGAVDRYEARLITAVNALDDSGLDGEGTLRSRGRVSSKKANRAAKTASKLDELPETAKALDEGRITGEHADAVADAAEQTSPEEADRELIDDAETEPADIFAKRSRKWANDNKKPAVDDDEQARRRRNRSGKKWVGDDNMAMFLFALDPDAGNDAWNALETRANEMFRDDGGRKAAPGTARTLEQRIADAFYELVTGNARTNTTRPVHPRHQINIGIDINAMTLDDDTPLATMIHDGQPLSDAIRQRLSCNSGLSIVLFDGPARPIWVGREHRYATVAQWRALLLRDRGCIGCGANPNRCEAHHIRPWPDLGDTDIDNLVLVCTRCHHDLHDRGMVLRRRDGRWHIEPGAGPVVEPMERQSTGRPPPSGDQPPPPAQHDPPPGDRNRPPNRPRKNEPDDPDQLRFVA